MAKSPRLAFGRVELLIILGIAGVVVPLLFCSMMSALLVPNIAKVRETAARTQTINNMRQCAIAVHNYHGTFNKLPNACWTGGIYGAGAERSMWFHLLPYVERDQDYKNNIHNAIVAAYLAPSDPWVGAAEGKLNFAGNIRLFGYKTLGKEVADDAVGVNGMPSGTTLAGKLSDKMQSLLKLSEISHGTANVLMLTTRYADCGLPVQSTYYSGSPIGTMLAGGGFPLSVGVPQGPVKGGFFGAGAYDRPADRKSIKATFQVAPRIQECIADDSVFGHSFSPGALSAALADASIKSVDPNMSTTTFCRALCPTDNHPLDNDWADGN
jgi:hypothetical protein